ncbi:MAG TPA: GNAT family N-acetyltransferase [Ktedonobacteraceae bacterium]
MIRERQGAPEPLKHLCGSSTLSQSRTIETRAGTLELRSFCSPSFVEELRVDRGLCAFARLPEREHALLLRIAKRPDSMLTLAYTPSGEIVGQVTIAPCDGWWQGLENIFEIAIEVSSSWRRLGLARELLKFSLELDALEDVILQAIGLAWHWDTQEVGLPAFRYRQLIARLFAPYGFLEYQTSEPNISMEAANILLVRIGSRVGQQRVGQFIDRLVDTANLLIW